MDENWNSNPIPAKKIGAKNPIAILFVVLWNVFKCFSPTNSFEISIEAKKAPMIKCSPILSVIVAKIRINTKNTANKDSLPFKKLKML